MPSSIASWRARASWRRSLIFIALTSIALAACGFPALGVLRIVTDAPRSRLFRGVYDQLPAMWQAMRPVLVREVSDEEMDMLVGEDEDVRESGDGSVVDGYYQPGRGENLPTITLRRSIRDGAAELVFAHEYAHYIWDSKLTEKQRRDFMRLWEKQELAGRLVTEYAAECVEEGFSEAISYYLLRPSVLRRRDEMTHGWITKTIDEAMKRHRQAQAEATQMESGVRH